MSDLLQIKTADWVLSVWCQSIEKRTKQLQKTLEKRGDGSIFTELRLSPACDLTSVEVVGVALAGVSGNLEAIELEPLFFENLCYEFEFEFSSAVDTVSAPRVAHALVEINSAFRYKAGRLRGNINTGNHIGWLRIPLQYSLAGQLQSVSLSLEILPVKMDVQRDLACMYQVIDARYPLWRFALAEKTEQHAGNSTQRGDFSLLWLAQFRRLQDELSRGLRRVFSAPHSRLLSASKTLRAEQIKSRLPARQEEKIRTDIADRREARRYQVAHKRLSVDTPENRFIKMVILTAVKNLERFKFQAEQLNQKLERSRLSADFFIEFDRNIEPLMRFKSQPLMQEVGRFTGLSRESLVLQQKPGYATVYRVWKELRYYLDFIGGNNAIATKSVDKLYEVWCFLEIRRILVDELGFTESESSNRLVNKNKLEMSMADGLTGAIKLNRGKECSIRLAHEPRISRDGKEYCVYGFGRQEPDIFVEVTIGKKQRFVWLFDAKYRVDSEHAQNKKTGEDYVPDDAINQMHRYRDALIRREPDSQGENKTRPVFAAFALYPGFYDQTSEIECNPYANAIDQVGIGAFPLLPSSDGSGSLWLQQFLTEKLGRKEQRYQQASPDRYYVEEPARIPYSGMQQLRYRDLTLVVTSAEDNRSDGYYEGFQSGSARTFHVRYTASQRQAISDNAVREIRYLAIAGFDMANKDRTAKWLWPVLTTKKVSAAELNDEAAGCSDLSAEDYWLFELGKPKELAESIGGFAVGHHHMKLTQAKELYGKKTFAEIDDVYSWLTERPAM